MLRASRKRSGLLVVSHAHMTETVHHALVEEDVVGDDEILDKASVWRLRRAEPCRLR